MTETTCKITLERGDFGTYLIGADDGRDTLIQTDWDFPGVANTFGWNIQDAQKYETDEDGMELEKKTTCDHSGTDGTVDCEKCGMTATEFITAAANWLDDNIGAEAEDPGYFSE